MKEAYEVLVILRPGQAADPAWLGTIKEVAGRAVVVTNPPPGLMKDYRIEGMYAGSMPRRCIANLDPVTAEFCRDRNRRLSREAIGVQQVKWLLDTA